MMKFNRNRIFTYALAAVFALALAGCGGSGGSSADMDGGMDGGMMPTEPERTPEEMCTDASGEWRDGACVSAEDLAAEAAAAAEEARMAAAAKVVADTKAAGTKEMAINAEATATPGADSLAFDDTDATDVYMAAIKRDRDSTTVMITDPGMAGDNDPKFMQAMDLGGGTTMHVRDNGEGVEEVVMVKTDIEAPTGVAFAKWQAAPGSTDLMPQELDAMKDDGEAPGADEEANALDILLNDDDATVESNLMFARSTTDGTLNYDRDNPGATPTADVDDGVVEKPLVL